MQPEVLRHRRRAAPQREIEAGLWTLCRRQASQVPSKRLHRESRLASPSCGAPMCPGFGDPLPHPETFHRAAKATHCHPASHGKQGRSSRTEDHHRWFCGSIAKLKPQFVVPNCHCIQSSLQVRFALSSHDQVVSVELATEPPITIWRQPHTWSGRVNCMGEAVNQVEQKRRQHPALSNACVFPRLRQECTQFAPGTACDGENGQ